MLADHGGIKSVYMNIPEIEVWFARLRLPFYSMQRVTLHDLQARVSRAILSSDRNFLETHI